MQNPNLIIRYIFPLINSNGIDSSIGFLTDTEIQGSSVYFVSNFFWNEFYPTKYSGMEILEECIKQSLMENPREIFLFLVQMKQADKLISREKIPMPCIHPKDMILGNTVLEIQNISELKKMRGGVPASISDIPYIEVGSKRRDHVIYPFTFEFDIDPKEVGRPFFGIDSVEFPNHKKQIS